MIPKDGYTDICLLKYILNTFSSSGLGASMPTFVGLSVGRSVGRSVCLSLEQKIKHCKNPRICITTRKKY